MRQGNGSPDDPLGCGDSPRLFTGPVIQCNINTNNGMAN